jgi:hypothetical protein
MPTTTVNLTDLPEDSPLVLAAHAVYERNATHGTPENTFGKIAALWSAYLDVDVEDHEVAEMMILMKVARSREGSVFHRDNYTDMCGYAELGCDLSEEYYAEQEAARNGVVADGGEQIDPAYEQAYRELVGDGWRDS